MLNGPAGSRHRPLPSAVNAINPKSWKNAYTPSPSVTGEGDAGPLTFSMRPLRTRGTSRRHNSLPLARSSARTTSLSLSTPVMKMCAAVRTGDECPEGTVVFHTTFVAGPNSDGRADVSATPVPLGPRKRDQPPSLELSRPVVACGEGGLGSVLAASAAATAKMVRILTVYCR